MAKREGPHKRPTREQMDERVKLDAAPEDAIKAFMQVPGDDEAEPSADHPDDD